MDERTFPLGVVLSVTSGKLLAQFGDVHELVEWMASRPVFTHALPDVADVCAELIRQQTPTIADVLVPTGLDTWEQVEAFLERVRFSTRLPAEVPVQRPDAVTFETFASPSERGGRIRL